MPFVQPTIVHSTLFALLLLWSITLQALEISSLSFVMQSHLVRIPFPCPWAF